MWFVRDALSRSWLCSRPTCGYQNDWGLRLACDQWRCSEYIRSLKAKYDLVAILVIRICCYESGISPSIQSLQAFAVFHSLSGGVRLPISCC